MKKIQLWQIIVVMTFLVSACSSNTATPSEELGLRHQESGENTYFRLGGIPFDQYIMASQKKILRNRVDITPENQLKILNANSPFEWIPDKNRCRKTKDDKYENGVLLIHGLSDSPSHMHDIGKFFLENCFLVRGILLPGHGTIPGDLLKVRYEEWIKASDYGIESFSGKVEKLSLVGFSTGGALGIYQALKRDKIHSLYLISPALKIKNDQIFLSGAVKTLSGIVESLTWVDIAKDEDYAKYESFPINAAYQIYQLTKLLDGRWQKSPLQIPVFTAASQDDMTIDTNQTIEFFLAQLNPKNRMILYSNEPVNIDDNRLTVKPGKYEQYNISEMSHISILHSPDDPHYGIKGDYRNCVHYLKFPDKLQLCKTKKNLPAGELLPEKLSGQVFMRLTYNPDFSELLLQMNEFMKAVP